MGDARDQAQFAARALIARLERELGEPLAPIMVERMIFAFEMGYLRGRTDGASEALKMFDGLAQARAKEEGEDESSK